MRLDYLFGAIALCLLAIYSVFGLYHDVRTAVKEQVPSTFSNGNGSTILSYSENLAELAGTQQDIDNDITSAQIEKDKDITTQIPGFMAFKKTYKTFDVMKNITQQMAKDTNALIDPIYLKTGIMIISILAAFLLIYLVFRNIIVS